MAGSAGTRAEVIRIMSRSRQVLVGVRDGWWVAAQIPLLALAAFLPPWFPAAARNAADLCVRFAGAALLLIASGMVLAASASLGRYLTPFPRPRDNARLRERGVYGLVRHPLYSGIILAAAGWSMWWLSWPGGVSMVLLGLFFDRKASYEEYWLSRTFESYADYRARVRKLIPWIY